jgi:hypothetical protein
MLGLPVSLNVRLLFDNRYADQPAIVEMCPKRTSYELIVSNAQETLDLFQDSVRGRIVLQQHVVFPLQRDEPCAGNSCGDLASWKRSLFLRQASFQPTPSVAKLSALGDDFLQIAYSFE